MSGIGADIVVSGGITMSEEPTIRSDLRIKNTIDYDLSAYEAFFLALKPSTFKYNKRHLRANSFWIYRPRCGTGYARCWIDLQSTCRTR